MYKAHLAGRGETASTSSLGAVVVEWRADCDSGIGVAADAARALKMHAERAVADREVAAALVAEVL